MSVDADPSLDGVATEVSARPFVRGFLTGTVAAGITTVWTVALALGSLPFLIDGLGVEAFGAWVLLQTFSAFRGWGALLDFGVGTAASTHVARHMSRGDTDTAGGLATYALGVSLVGGLLGTVALLVAVEVGLGGALGLHGVLADDFATAARWYAIGLPIDLLGRTAQFVFEGMQRVELSRLLEVLRRTSIAVGTVIAALRTHDLVTVAQVNLIVSVPVTVLSLVWLGRQLRPRLGHGTPARAMVAFGLRVAALRPLGTVHRMMDRLVVGAILGPGAVTLVEVATQVQGGAESVLTASAYSVAPSSAWLQEREESEHARRTLVLQATRLCLLVTLPFVIGPAIASAVLVDVWLGDGSSGAAGLIPVALAFTAVGALGHVASEYLVGAGRVGPVFRGALAAVVANLALTLLLVPRVGVVGAFLGSLLSVPLAIVPIIRAALDEIGLNVRHFVRTSIVPVAPPAVALAGVCVAVLLLPLGGATTIAVTAVLGGAVYLGVATLTTDVRAIMRGVIR